MKNIIIFLLCLLPALAWGQFPANPSKVVQGRQTTAAGLVAVTNTSPPGWTPTNWRHDAFMALDTVNARLWCWDGGEADWGECGASGGGGGVDTMYLGGDSLFVVSGADTFFVVLPAGLTEAEVAAQIEDSLAAYVPTITTDPSLAGLGTPLSPLRVSPAPRTLNDTGPSATIGQTEYDEYDLYLFSFNGTKALTISAADTVAAYRLELVNTGTGLLNVTGATAPTGFSASVISGGSAIAYSATGATWRITGDLVRTSGGDGALSVGAGTSTTALIQSSTAGSDPVTIAVGPGMTIEENTGTGVITLDAPGGGGGSSEVPARVNYKPSLGCVIGNSTIAAFGGNTAVANFLPVDNSLGDTVISIAIAGHTITQQRAAFLAHPRRYDFDYVVIQVGLNDLNPATWDSLTLINNYRTLVDTIRFTNPEIVIIGATMLPAYTRLVNIYGGGADDAQDNWSDLNEAIVRGFIEGIDYTVSRHTYTLGDPTDRRRLAPAFDVGDGIHENNAGRQLIATAWTRILNEAGFLEIEKSATSDGVTIFGTGTPSDPLRTDPSAQVLTVPGPTYTLTSEDASIYRTIIFTLGTGGGNVTLTVPDTLATNFYSLTLVKTAAGILTVNGATPPRQRAAQIGQNAAATLASADGAVWHISGELIENVCTLTASSGTVTWNAALCAKAKLTLAGDYTLAITNAREAEFLTLAIAQDGTGGRTLAWPSGTRSQGGAPLSVSTAANAEDVAIFYTRASGFNLEIGKFYAE